MISGRRRRGDSKSDARVSLRSSRAMSRAQRAQFLRHVGGAAQLLQHAPGVGRFGHVQRASADFPAGPACPATRRCQARRPSASIQRHPSGGVGERIADKVGHQYPARDAELVQRDDRAAVARRCDFRKVKRRQHRRDADRQADEKAADRPVRRHSPRRRRSPAPTMNSNPACKITRRRPIRSDR